MRLLTSSSTVYGWVAEIKRGLASLENAPNTERLKIIAIQEIVLKFYDMVLDDRRLKVREIAETLRTSNDRVGYIK